MARVIIVGDGPAWLPAAVFLARGGHEAIDTEYRTGVDRLYAVGRAARPERSQAIISPGAGATAALDMLAREAGQDVTDWDSPG